MLHVVNYCYSCTLQCIMMCIFFTPNIHSHNLMDCTLFSLQNISECDLEVPTGIPGFAEGPGRLSTQVANSPPSQTQPLHVETPLNSFSSTVLSSSEVFLVDGVVVMFAGLSTGEVRKVCTVSSMCCVVSHCSVHHPCCIPVQYTAVNFTANQIDPSPERTWSLSSSVKSLTYSRGSDYVYAVTGTTVSYSG